MTNSEVRTVKQRTKFTTQTFNVIVDGMYAGYVKKVRQADGQWPSEWQVWAVRDQKLNQLPGADCVSHGATLVSQFIQG